MHTVTVSTDRVIGLCHPVRTPTLVATGVPRTYVSGDYCGAGLAAGPLGHRRSVTLWLERSRSGAASLGELAVDVLAGLLFGGQGHCGRVEAPCAFRKGSNYLNLQTRPMSIANASSLWQQGEPAPSTPSAS